MDDDFFAVRVTDPKGSTGETPPVTTDPRPHIRRRDGAIARLRGLTTTAAVAGIAGTAVFGAVAATSWSGDPNASSAADLGPGSGTTNDNSGSDQQTAPDPESIFGTNPGTGSSGQATNPSPTRVRPSTGGRSHATTGGSG
jgi:hypothetical protein